ncbi:MAG: SRPBCC family protein [Actinomycetota bacterium]
MPHIEIDVDTSLTPAEVIGAFTDFTERRTELFPGLAPQYFKVHSQTETSADVMEGTARPKIWAREVYDWSSGDSVSWKVVESNVFDAGTVINVAPSATEGGSRVHVSWERRAKSLKGRLLLMLLTASGGRFMHRYYNDMFDDLEKKLAGA